MQMSFFVQQANPVISDLYKLDLWLELEWILFHINLSLVLNIYHKIPWHCVRTPTRLNTTYPPPVSCLFIKELAMKIFVMDYHPSGY